ncbi:hypothetical protein [Ralstonia solanacearum]|uniref:hypothetical protein n=1 Tax=Ralstonia solanacearum TaxID=305 RepID=UPI0001D95644|nr:hypothetical protein [Ralstonia solanacearum]CBJ41352.1 protein of unknown function [Ralstonia solanacearum CFBP2957]
MFTKEDEIWNRAALDGGGKNPSEGDVNLASALLLHSLAMNGGVLHALQVLTDQQRVAAMVGFRYFGFYKVADLLSEPFSDTDEDEERLEDTYSQEIPLDEVLFNAFCAKLATDSQAFAA